MNPRVFALAVLCWAGAAHAQNQMALMGVGTGPPKITLVQTCTQTADNSGAAQTTLAASCTGVKFGDMILAGVDWCYDNSCVATTGNDISSISSLLGNTCTAQAGTHTTGMAVPIQVWKCPVTVGGNETLTVHFASTGSVFPVLDLSEWSRNGTGESASVTINNAGVNSLGSSSTTSQPTELVYCMGGGYGTITPSQTQITSGAANTSGIDSFKYGTTPASNTCTYTGSANVVSVAAIAFK